MRPASFLLLASVPLGVALLHCGGLVDGGDERADARARDDATVPQDASADRPPVHDAATDGSPEGDAGTGLRDGSGSDGVAADVAENDAIDEGAQDSMSEKDAATGCISGDPCGDAGPCKVGTISCDTGVPVCQAGNAADGTECGTSSLCCAGVCAECSATMDASVSCVGTTCSVVCSIELNLCNGLCVDPESDTQACGPNCKMCPSGSTCTSGECEAFIGEPTPFSPCQATSIGAGTLVAQQVTLPHPLSVTSFGVVSAADGGTQGIVALYIDAGGVPGTLVARSAATAIVMGTTTPLADPIVTLDAGTYWLVATFSGSTSVCADSSTSNELVTGTTSFPTVPATFGTATVMSASADLNIFVLGLE